MASTKGWWRLNEPKGLHPLLQMLTKPTWIVVYDELKYPVKHFGMSLACHTTEACYSG